MVASFLLLMNIIITMQGMEQVPNFMLNLENCNEDLKLNQSKEISQQCLLKRVLRKLQFSSVQFSPQSCPKLCNPMNHSMPGLPVHHQILECTKTHVHRVSDAIQPSHPLSKASILWGSAFFIVQLSHPYMTTGKTIALTRRTFVDKVIYPLLLLLLLLSRLSRV